MMPMNTLKADLDLTNIQYQILKQTLKDSIKINSKRLFKVKNNVRVGVLKQLEKMESDKNEKTKAPAIIA